MSTTVYASPRGRADAGARMELDDWFLTLEKRGYPAIERDGRRGDDTAWAGMQPGRTFDSRLDF